MKKNEFEKEINGVYCYGYMFVANANDFGGTPEEQAEYIINGLSLTEGEIIFERNLFEVRGLSNGKSLHIEQYGEYDMYGGPYDPKFKKPKILFDGNDVYEKVLSAFENYPWETEKGNHIDVSRVDIYGYLFRMMLDDSDKYAKGSTIGGKKKTNFTISEYIKIEKQKLTEHNAKAHQDDQLDWADWKSELTNKDTKEYGIFYNRKMLDSNGDRGVFEYLPENKNYTEDEYAKGGGVKDKTQLEDVVIYHESKGNFLYSKGTIYAWLYDVPNAEQKIQSGEFDFVFFPLGRSRFGASRQTPALLKVWNKSFQKNRKGSEHLIGISQGFFNEEEGILYIEMMTTRKDYRRKGVNSKIVKAMRDYFKLPQDKVVFLDTTKEGKKFEDAKTYNQGGGIEFVPEKKGTLIKGNEIIKYFEKVNGNYRLVFYTLNEAKGKVPKMCDAFSYCQELDSNDVTTEQLVELIKKNNLMENGGSIIESSSKLFTYTIGGL